jgi:methylated-DNA-[protein]-cysteine S-methyltransferase
MKKFQNCYIKTPLGPVQITGDNDGITGIQFVQSMGSKKKELSPVLKKGMVQLSEYFEASRKNFNVKLQLRGTDFQLKVWKALIEIPYGKTVTYNSIALSVGSPGGARAVGAACNKNPVAVIVPCHRVIGANGSLTGYRGGTGKKKWLLDREAANPRKMI